MSGITKKRKRLRLDERKKIFHKFGGRCAYCGKVIRYADMHIDHITPFSSGGKDSAENMFPSCADCDTVKGQLNPSEFRKKLQNISKELEKNPKFRTAVRFGLVKSCAYKTVKFYYETKGARIK